MSSSAHSSPPPLHRPPLLPLQPAHLSFSSFSPSLSLSMLLSLPLSLFLYLSLSLSHPPPPLSFYTPLSLFLCLSLSLSHSPPSPFHPFLSLSPCVCECVL